MKIPDSQIAVTLFNVCQHCKTESDLDCTLDKLCAIGYQVVQVSAINLDPVIIRKQLDKHRLYCCATHEGMAAIGAADLSPLVEKLQILGCNFTALGYPPEEYHTQDGMRKLAEILNTQGEKLLEKGIRLGYHNHDFEFERKGGKTTILETFYNTADPKKVCAELDVHWVARGGGCPVSWIRKLAGRIPVIHFKDFTRYNGEPLFCEIGEGNLDWTGILEACRETGVDFYSIEQDKPFPGHDIFDSMRISFDNLRAMGVE